MNKQSLFTFWNLKRLDPGMADNDHLLTSGSFAWIGIKTTEEREMPLALRLYAYPARTTVRFRLCLIHLFLLVHLFFRSRSAWSLHSAALSISSPSRSWSSSTRMLGRHFPLGSFHWACSCYLGGVDCLQAWWILCPSNNIISFIAYSMD